MKTRVVSLLLVLSMGVSAYQFLLLDDAPPDQTLPDDYANFDDVETILDGMGITYTHWHNNWFYRYSADIDFLRDYDIILWYNDNRAIGQDEYDAMWTWAGEGNYLAVTGEDSLGSPNDPQMADLIGSSLYGDYPYCDKFTVTKSDSWIMDGPAGYFEGEFDLLPEARDLDKAAPIPPGTYQVALSLIGTESPYTIGPAKILVTENIGGAMGGGIIVYWNGNYDAVEWWRMSQTPDTVNMFRNMVYYFTDNVPAVVETSWGVIKGSFTP